MKAPYGFVEDDIHWLVARLFKRGDLSFTVNGESVNLNNRSEEEIIGYITKKQFVDKLLTEVRVRVPENQKKAVRTVMKELFNGLKWLVVIRKGQQQRRNLTWAGLIGWKRLMLRWMISDINAAWRVI